MPNIMKLMKQASAVQKKLAAAQEELAGKTVEFSSGGGTVKAVASGDGSITGLTIDPKAVDPSDVEMLEDMVLAAVQGAIQAARDLGAREMSKITGDLGLPPGMGIPGL